VDHHPRFVSWELPHIKVVIAKFGQERRVPHFSRVFCARSGTIPAAMKSRSTADGPEDLDGGRPHWKAAANPGGFGLNTQDGDPRRTRNNSA
jgi:hypothetical protein